MYEKQKFKEFLHVLSDVFSDNPELTHVACHEINTCYAAPVARCDKVKQSVRNQHIKKISKGNSIMSTDSSIASPIALGRKNNGKNSDDPEAWRFVVDYHKLIAVTQYPQFPIPLCGIPLCVFLCFEKEECKFRVFTRSSECFCSPSPLLSSPIQIICYKFKYIVMLVLLALVQCYPRNVDL